MKRRPVRERKPVKNALLSILHTAYDIAWFSPVLTLVGLGYLANMGYDSWQENIKAENIKPRQEYAQKLVDELVANGEGICDPARQRPNSPAELNETLDRLFAKPIKLGDNIDMDNMQNGMSLQWVKAMGVKICSDTQMESSVAAIWHPKEKILAVNGNYETHLLAPHLRIAILELSRRSSNNFYTQESDPAKVVNPRPPLTEKFAISTTTRSQALGGMVIEKENMTQSQRNLSAPVRTGPKMGS